MAELEKCEQQGGCEPPDRPKLSTLPDDIWYKIAAYLNCGERANLAAATRKFRHAMDHGDLVFKSNFYSGPNMEDGSNRSLSFARFLAIQRPRFWQKVDIGWYHGDSELLTKWLIQPQLTLSCLWRLDLTTATVHVRRLTPLAQVSMIQLEECELVVDSCEDPWPLLSSSSRALRILGFRKCTFRLPDQVLCTTLPLLEVDLPCLMSITGFCLFWLAAYDMDYLFHQGGVLPFRFKGGLPPSTCTVIHTFPYMSERSFIVYDGGKTRWPPHVLEQGSQLPRDASFPHLSRLAHACLRLDFPLSASLTHLRVALARPWEFFDRVILLCKREELPNLAELRLTGRDESLPWVPPKRLGDLNCLQTLTTLMLPPFKEEHGPLVEGINQLTRLTRLGLMLPSLGDQSAAVQVDPALVIRLDLPQLAQLTVDVQVGTVDVRGCPDLWEVRRAQAPAALVARLLSQVGENLDGLDGPMLQEWLHVNTRQHWGPCEASPDDGILLPRAGSWHHRDWIHGSWSYKDEHCGWVWCAQDSE